MDVAAPLAGVFMNGRMNGTRTLKMRPKSSAPKAVLTTPGWSTFDVTPVPSRRRASSYVNITLASFACGYALRSE